MPRRPHIKTRPQFLNFLVFTLVFPRTIIVVYLTINASFTILHVFWEKILTDIIQCVRQHQTESFILLSPVYMCGDCFDIHMFVFSKVSIIDAQNSSVVSSCSVYKKLQTSCLSSSYHCLHLQVYGSILTNILLTV